MNKINLWKHAAITGLLTGTFAVVVFSLADNLNRSNNWNYNPVTLRGLTGLLTIVILAIGIYTGMAKVKRDNGRKLTYRQALLSGIMISVVTGIITAAIGLIYSLIINPGYADYLIRENQRIMQINHNNAAEIAASTASLQKQMSTTIQIVQALAGQIVSGTLLSIIIGAFVKSNRD